MDDADGLGMVTVAQDHVTSRRAAGVDEPLDFQRGVNVRIAPVAVLRHPADIERLKPGRDDDRADGDFPKFLLLLEVDRLPIAAGLHAGLLALVRQDTALEVQADFRVDQHHLGRGLRERNVHRLALAEAFIEIVVEFGLLVDAMGDALLAAGAEVFQHVPRLAADGHLEVAHIAVHFHDLRVAPQRDVLVGADLGHLRSQNAGRAVQRREGLVELGHVPADGGLTLHEVNLLAGVSQRQGRVDAGDAAAHDQHVGMDRHLLHLKGPVMRDAPDGGAGEGLGFRGGLGAVGVHPRVVLADVDHVEKEWVQSAGFDRAAEGVLMQERRARRHDDPIQAELLDVLLNQLLARIRAHVLVVARDDHVGHGGDISGQCLHIHHPGDVGAAMADIKADPNVMVAVNLVHWSPYVGKIASWSGSSCVRRPRAAVGRMPVSASGRSRAAGRVPFRTGRRRGRSIG